MIDTREKEIKIIAITKVYKKYKLIKCFQNRKITLTVKVFHDGSREVLYTNFICPDCGIRTTTDKITVPAGQNMQIYCVCGHII